MTYYDQFYSQLIKVKDKITPPHFTFRVDYVSHLLKDVIENSVPDNEGYAQSCCLPFIASVVAQINQSCNEKEYMYGSYPIVFKDNGDQRRNKKADWSLYRIYNRRTYIIIECKKTVRLILSDKKDISQLLLEALYIKENEKKQFILSAIVYTDRWCNRVALSRLEFSTGRGTSHQLHYGKCRSILGTT